MNTQIQKTKVNSLAKILQSDAFKSQIALALPKHLTADRFLRVALTEIRKNPKLAECSQNSFLGAIVQCSQLGLEPGDGLGHAYLVPYKSDCQLIIGYRGFIELARRSGLLSTFEARAVYENDIFELEYGLTPKFRHVPTLENREKLIAVYAKAQLKDGFQQYEVMSKEEIESIRKFSKTASSSYSPWNTSYDEMAKKTVVRRISKYMPLTPEIQRAVILDEKADLGKQSTDLDFVLLDNETGEIYQEEKEVPISQSEQLAKDLKENEK